MFFLRGTVKDLDSSARAVKIAATGGKVVNLLNVEVPASDPQILLKVRFISVDRTKEQQLGINLFTTGLGNTLGSVSTGQFSRPRSASQPGSTTVAMASPASASATVWRGGECAESFRFLSRPESGRNHPGAGEQSRGAGSGRAQPAGGQRQTGQLPGRRASIPIPWFRAARAARERRSRSGSRSMEFA